MRFLAPIFPNMFLPKEKAIPQNPFTCHSNIQIHSIEKNSIQKVLSIKCYIHLPPLWKFWRCDRFIFISDCNLIELSWFKGSNSSIIIFKSTPKQVTIIKFVISAYYYAAYIVNKTTRRKTNVAYKYAFSDLENSFFPYP